MDRTRLNFFFNNELSKNFSPFLLFRKIKPKKKRLKIRLKRKRAIIHIKKKATINLRYLYNHINFRKKIKYARLKALHFSKLNKDKFLSKVFLRNIFFKEKSVFIISF